jgi:peptidoglycan/xylan/chitin deacetylase (PgdA/CDA1 family)
MDVIIVCHTEFGSVVGDAISWDQNPIGVDKGVPNLVAVAEQAGAKITFAVMPEVAPHFVPAPGHEIALHIHAGWEPFINDGKTEHMGDRYLWEHCNQQEISSVLKDHPLNEQREIIKTGGDLIEDLFGVKSTTFVAGRWSLNNNTVKALIEYGIERDCSAPASAAPCHHDWSRLPRICMPYHPSENDYQSRGNLPLLMIPISQTLMFGSVNPEILPIAGFSWLKACFEEYYSQGAPLFHICLHSPCMTSPLFSTTMRDLLTFIASHQNIHFRTASEINEYQNPPKLHSRLLPYLFAVNKTQMKTNINALRSRI